MSAIPTTVRIASTRIARTSAAPRSPERRYLAVREQAATNVRRDLTNLASESVVAKIDLQRLNPAPVLRTSGSRARSIHEHEARRQRRFVCRIGILRSRQDRDHHGMESGEMSRDGTGG